MERATNDATLSKLGDIYQYYIALLDCFRMKKGDKLQIEVNGDVSIITNKNDDSFQKEVKHHIGDNKLSDRDEDLWNTLKNWVSNYDRINNYHSLILFTTADISEKCVFYDWNKKTPQEKLGIIIKVGELKKKREKVFRDLYKQIVDNVSENEEKLLCILKRFSIKCLQPNIENISVEFDDVLGYIPPSNRNRFTAALLGMLISIAKDKPHIWEVSKEEFDKMVQEQTPLYCNPSKVPLPDDFADAELSVEKQKIFNDKLFVIEIQKIEYRSVIPQAITDFWRMDMTVLRYFNDDLMYNKSLSDYRKDLVSRLFYTKQDKIIDFENSEKQEQIRESKKLYNQIMAWNADDFGSIIGNRLYFKNGLIHEIVDSGDFNWEVGEKDEC